MNETDTFAVADLALGTAQVAGADEAEAFVEDVVATQIRVFDGQVETLRTVRSRGVGLRVGIAGRRGGSFSSRTDPAGLAQLAERALRAARLVRVDPGGELPSPAPFAPVPAACQQSMSELPLERKLAVAVATERAARSGGPTIIGTDDVEYFDFDRAVSVTSTAGMRRRARHSLAILTATAVAEGRGEYQSGTMSAFAREFDELVPDDVGRRAAARAARVAGARLAATTEVPVILDSWVALRFVDLLAHSVSAESVRKGRSCLKGRLNHLVASPMLTLVDDGGDLRAPFVAPFDSEGVPTRTTPVIRNGQLQSFLYDSYEARAAGAHSTGNATRETFRETPTIGKNSLYIAPGEWRPESILDSTDRGLYVQEIHGMHLANPVSGDFSLGVTGGWIQDGEWAYAVRGVTVAGNLFELLERVDAIGNDLHFGVTPKVIVTSSGAPTLRVSSLAVSGDGLAAASLR